jgi:single-strand DNA-binding protein
VNILGNVGSDPSIRQVNGSQVAEFSVATNRSYKSNGETKQESQWHNVVVWGRESAVELIRKGCLVDVEGRLETKSYDKVHEVPGGGSITVKHYKTRIVAENLIVLPKPSREQADDNQPDPWDRP